MSIPQPRVVLYFDPTTLNVFRYLQCRTPSMKRDLLWGWATRFTVTRTSRMWRCSCVRAKVFVRLKLSVVFSEGSADGRPIFSSASVNGLMLKFSMSPVTRGFTKPVNMTVRFNQKTHTHVDWFNNNGTIHTLCASVKRAAPINFHTRKIKM